MQTNLKNSQLKMLCVAVGFGLLAGCATQNAANGPQIDRISEAELHRILPQPVAKISLEEIVTLSKSGQTPAQIIEKIKASDSYYALTPSQSLKLNKQGVNQEVLDYMYTSNEAKTRNNVADEINQREKQKHEALEQLKRQQSQRLMYDPWGGFGPYGYGRFGYGSRFGWGGYYGRPFGWW